MLFKTNYSVDYKNRSDSNGEDTLFTGRWSPRSFMNEKIPQEVYESIFGAARWSQSCFNEQPWLFVTESGEDDRELFLDLLLPRNREWAQNSSLIGYIFSRKNFSRNEKSNRWADFDTGAAWMAMTLQARLLGLYTHGMAGINRDEVFTSLHVSPDEYNVLCGFVIGIIDTPDKLNDSMKNREIPSSRKPLNEVWKRGAF